MTTEASIVQRLAKKMRGDDNEKWLNLLRAHAMPITIAILVLLALIAVPLLLAAQRHQAALAASRMLAVAQNPGQFEEIINQYPRSAAAPQAVMALASDYFHAGDYDAAAELYRRFPRQYPRHALAPAAALGLAMCHEARGDQDAALLAFAAFLENHPDHYLAPQASFGKARCRAAAGDFDSARIIYENFIASHPDSAWSSQAEMALNLLLQRSPAGHPAPTMVF